MDTLKGGYESVLFTGHSLGGTSAFCLSMAFPDSRCVCFNPGASPTNPIYSGPGPSRATVYHVVGDIISSHMSSKAALIFRVKLQVQFGNFDEEDLFKEQSDLNIISDAIFDEAKPNWKILRVCRERSEHTNTYEKL